MTDIIWGNGVDILSGNSFVINVTHRKNGNKKDYSDTENIKIVEAELPGLPYNESDWDLESLKSCIVNAFLKCEVNDREESGMLIAKVSHSGAGGY